MSRIAAKWLSSGKIYGSKAYAAHWPFTVTGYGDLYNSSGEDHANQYVDPMIFPIIVNLDTRQEDKKRFKEYLMNWSQSYSIGLDDGQLALLVDDAYDFAHKISSLAYEIAKRKGRVEFTEEDVKESLAQLS